MNDVCQLLKETRLEKGLSLDEVAQRTYIKLHYLEALEEGELSKLPAMVHTYGYIRQYAKLLGLDGGALVAQFQQLERGAPLPERPAMANGAKPEIYAGSDSMSFLKPMKASYNGHVPAINGNHLPASSATAEPSGYAAPAEPAPVRAPAEAVDLVAARAQAQEILLAAEREARQLVRGAEGYADEVLGRLEAEVGQTLQVIQNGRQFLAARRHQQ